jgi:hypothetical protein
MPWYQEAMKEAAGCHKLRGAVKQAMIRRFPNGETRLGKPKTSLSEYIGQGSERSELKHLSKIRKRKRSDFPSSGERKGNSPNSHHVIVCARCGVGVAGRNRTRGTAFVFILLDVAELLWKEQPKKVTAL